MLEISRYIPGDRHPIDKEPASSAGMMNNAILPGGLSNRRQVKLCAALFETDFHTLTDKMFAANWDPDIIGQALAALISEWRRNIVNYSETLTQIASCFAQPPSTPTEIDAQLTSIRRELHRLDGDSSHFASNLRQSQFSLMARLADLAKGAQRLKIQRLLAKALEDDAVSAEQWVNNGHGNQLRHIREGVA